MFETTPLTRYVAGRVRIGLRQHAARVPGGAFSHQHLRPAEEEALLRREAVERRAARRRARPARYAISARRRPPLSAVFSPSVSLPFSFTSSTAVKPRVLVDDALRALLERLRVGRASTSRFRLPCASNCRP